MAILKKTSPYLHRKDSMARMLGDVLIALAPTAVMAIVVFGLAAFRNLAISVAVMCLAEFVYVLIRNRIPYDGKKHTFKEQWKAGVSKYTINNFLAPCLSGVIFALIMPASTNPGYVIYVALIVGALVGIVIGKLVFGGTGSNIFNPAALGMVFTKLCFGSKFTYESNYFITNIATGGTPLTNLGSYTYPGVSNYVGQFAGINDYSVLDLFLGRVPGMIGEVFKITILVGMIYLLFRHAIDFRVLVSYLGCYAFLMALAGIIVCNKIPTVNFGQFMGFAMLSGGVLFGAVFMFTDPVTMPIDSPSRVMYGLLGGALTVIIRIFGALPEGVAFSILLCNMMAPVLDYPAWSGRVYTKKKVAVMASIVLIPAIILVLALLFAPEVKA